MVTPTKKFLILTTLITCCIVIGFFISSLFFKLKGNWSGPSINRAFGDGSYIEINDKGEVAIRGSFYDETPRSTPQGRMLDQAANIQRQGVFTVLFTPTDKAVKGYGGIYLGVFIIFNMDGEHSIIWRKY